jgi:hypothetical protein
MIVAVDFDGTLCENRYPYAGLPNYALLNVLRQLKASGEIELILWSCRIGEPLRFAVDWCKEQGLEFDAVNENLPRIVEQFGGDNRKVFANLYIDDASIDLSMETMECMINSEYVFRKDKYIESYIRDSIRERNNA